MEACLKVLPWIGERESTHILQDPYGCGSVSRLVVQRPSNYHPTTLYERERGVYSRGIRVCEVDFICWASLDA